MQQTRAEPREYTGDNGHEHCQPCRPARDNEHYRHGGAEGKGAVDCQVGNVEQTERDEHSECHKTPYKSLSNAAGEVFCQLQQAE